MRNKAGSRMSPDRSTDRKIRHAVGQAARPHLTDVQRQRHLRDAAGLALSRGMWLSPFAVDFNALPQEIDLTAPNALARLFFYLALFFLVMTAIPFLILAGSDGIPWWGVVLAATPPLASAAAMIACGRVMARRRRARFEDDRVTVRLRGLSGSTEWSEPYSAFRGIQPRTQTIDTRYDRKTFQLVELVHDDPEKSVALMIAEGDQPLHDACASFAARLGLAVMLAAPAAGS